MTLTPKPLKRKILAPKSFTKGSGGLLKARVARNLPRRRVLGVRDAKSGVGKPWGLKKADTEFRKFMLENVPVKCEFPNCPITDPKKLTVSHYFGRVKKGTRFYPPNCCFLCRNHHYWDKQLGWEFQKQTKEEHGWDGRYTLYMKEKLGEENFEMLVLKSRCKISPKKAIEEFRTSLLSV